MQPGPTMKHHHTTHVTGWQLPINQQTSINNDTEKWEHPSSHYRKQDEGSSKTDKTSTTGHSNSISGELPEEYENTNSKQYLYTHISCSIPYNSEDIKLNKMTIALLVLYNLEEIKNVI